MAMVIRPERAGWPGEHAVDERGRRVDGGGSLGELVLRPSPPKQLSIAPCQRAGGELPAVGTVRGGRLTVSVVLILTRDYAEAECRFGLGPKLGRLLNSAADNALTTQGTTPLYELAQLKSDRYLVV